MWDAAGSPSAWTPPGSPPATCRDKARPHPQRQRSVIQGWPFSWLWWQIRPQERGGRQGCPSAPVFVHQLGLISSVLTVVHWFPLHVPRAFQTPSQNSSVLSPESSCLWTHAILGFSPFLPPPPSFCPPSSFKLCSPGPAQRVDPGQPCWGTHRVPGDAQNGHQHPPIISSAGLSSDSSKPLYRTSPASCLAGRAALHPHPPGWQSHTSSAIFPPDVNHFSLSLLTSINPTTWGRGSPAQSTWNRSLPVHRAGVMAAWIITVVELPWGSFPRASSLKSSTLLARRNLMLWAV